MPNSATLQTHQQQYANRAWDAIAAQKSQPLAADYKRQADHFPALVLQAGLAQALGFMLAKDKKGSAHKVYLNDLCAVISAVHGGAQDASERSREVFKADASAYQRHTRQFLSAAAWFKRLAQAELSDEAAAPEARQEENT